MEASATRTASFWLSASASSVRFSTQGIALSASIDGQGGFPTASALQLLGDLPFGPVEAGEEDAAPAVEIIGDYRAILKFEAKRRFDELCRHLEQLLA